MTGTCATTWSRVRRCDLTVESVCRVYKAGFTAGAHREIRDGTSQTHFRPMDTSAAGRDHSRDGGTILRSGSSYPVRVGPLMLGDAPAVECSDGPTLTSIRIDCQLKYADPTEIYGIIFDFNIRPSRAERPLLS